MADDPVWQSQAAFAEALTLADDDVLARDKSDTTDDVTHGTVKRLAFSGLLGAAGILPGGRLTTESGVPVSSSDRTSQGTLYYTPYLHDYVRLYDGTRPKLYTFTERSLSLTMTSGKNYDVFLYDNSGTLTLELSSAWTNDTTRADALAWQAGVGWVKSGAATRLWLGTIRASGTNVTEDSASKRFVWNVYNQVSRYMRCIDSTDSWTYTTATWRQANGSSANKVEWVAGDVHEYDAHVLSLVNNSGAAGVSAGVGIDSTSAYTGLPGFTIPNSNVVLNQAKITTACARGRLAAGYHYAAWLEYSHAYGTTTWYGDAGVSSYVQSGLECEVAG
jgi:hypothetical protein